MNEVVIIQHIELEDRWQDFHTFDLTNDFKIANANLQGWLWDGRQLATMRPLKRGDAIIFADDGGQLAYRVTSARKIKQSIAA